MGKLLLLLSLFSSCGYIDKKFGRSQGYSQVTIRQEGSQDFSTSSILNGGLIVYAIKEDGSRKAASLANENGALTITLPNGNYQFHAVGWPKAGLESVSPPSSNLRCGSSNPISLTGQATTVSLSLNSGNCASSSMFANSDAKTGGTIPNLQFVNCAPTNNTNVGSAGGKCEANKGSYVGSGRVRLLTYDLSNGPSILENGSLASGCFSGTFVGGLPIPAPLVIPPGVPGANSPFATRIEVFPEADCAGSPVVYDFPNGIAAGSPGKTTALFGNGSGDLSLYLNAPAALEDPLLLYSGNIAATGDADGIGINAAFGAVAGMAADSYGNLFLADAGNNTIRKIQRGGAVSTIAGIPGVTGSADGPGDTATFNTPSGVAVDSTGNLYVTDTGNQTIRKIDPTGVVSTIAGSPGVDGPTDGTGSSARFSNPVGIAVDSSGNLYVADQNNHNIRKITPAAAVTTLAGSGGSGSADGVGAAAQFNSPAGLALDSAGNLFVADKLNHTIRKIILSSATVSTFAGTANSIGSGDGSGGSASFHSPSDIGIDASGNLFVADFDNSIVRKITAAGVVSTYAGLANSMGIVDGTGSAARFSNPFSIAVNSVGQVFVGDGGNNNIRKITPGAVVTSYAGLASQIGSANGPRLSATYNSPSDIAADSNGDLYVADASNFTIRKITVAGTVSTFAGSGTSADVDGTGTGASFVSPRGLTIDSSGNLYVADGTGEKIRKITPGGVVTSFAGGGSQGSGDGTGAGASFSNPSSVAADSAGNIYVADTGNHTIRKITPGGVVTTLAGLAGSPGSNDGTGSAARFYLPKGIAVDSSYLYISDSENHTIRKLNLSNNAVTTLAGNAGTPGDADGTGAAAEFDTPLGLKVDGIGNVYVADQFNSLIRKITPAGVVTTVIGDPGAMGGQTGSLQSALFAPSGLALYNGKLYFVESNGVVQATLP